MTDVEAVCGQSPLECIAHVVLVPRALDGEVAPQPVAEVDESPRVDVLAEPPRVDGAMDPWKPELRVVGIQEREDVPSRDGQYELPSRREDAVDLGQQGVLVGHVLQHVQR